MAVQRRLFSERYRLLRGQKTDAARERPASVTEEIVQCIWYDQLFSGDRLQSTDETPIKVLSPGWWNRAEGPDFKGAQIEIAGRLKTGDVEVDLRHNGWRQHGHATNHGFDDVILHVVLESSPPPWPVRTLGGNKVHTLLLPRYLETDLQELADNIDVSDYPHAADRTYGHCAALTEAHGKDRLLELLYLAGEWRTLFKARRMRERMDRAGADQAIYEEFMTACGFSQFKPHFRAIAQELHYDRARQLAREDPLLLEAAYLQLAGLLPEDPPDGTDGPPHYARLHQLKVERLSGLRRMPLEWKRVGVRPNNNPERRLAGAARFVARTAATGLSDTLTDLWLTDGKNIDRRRAFENVFPGPIGFWAKHCTWTGKPHATVSAPIGAGRVRSIIGNVFVPAGLAVARARKDRRLEERVLDFFAALPKEPDNKIQTAMLPRVFGANPKTKIDFRTQQGLLQMYHDWCEPNPSCRNCRVIPFLDTEKTIGTSAY